MLKQRKQAESGKKRPHCFPLIVNKRCHLMIDEDVVTVDVQQQCFDGDDDNFDLGKV